MIALIKPLEQALDRMDQALAVRDAARGDAWKAIDVIAPLRSEHRREGDLSRSDFWVAAELVRGAVKPVGRLAAFTRAATRRLRVEGLMAEALRLAVMSRNAVRAGARSAIVVCKVTAKRLVSLFWRRW